MNDPAFQQTLLLIRSAQAGDEAAREQLFARYLPRVAAMAALYLGHRLARMVERDDVVQDAMMRAIGGLDDFQPQGEGAFQAFLARQ